jgi:monofunctional biosynthetic peptidoglycan transglycosylase
MKPVFTQAGRVVTLLAISVLALQAYFFARVVLMTWVDPHSTTFQRSEARRLLVERRGLDWSQTWADYDDISPYLPRRRSRAAARSPDRRRLHHHPAACQEPVPLG